MLLRIFWRPLQRDRLSYLPFSTEDITYFLGAMFPPSPCEDKWGTLCRDSDMGNCGETEWDCIVIYRSGDREAVQYSFEAVSGLFPLSSPT